MTVDAAFPDAARFEPILIVGGSTRAAAWSAMRAGFRPVCADLYSDIDTRHVSEVVSVRDYPTSIPDDVRHTRAAGWFYTGALENHPELIESICCHSSTCGPLLGTSAKSLRLVRDPAWLAETLQSASLPALEVRSQSKPPETDGHWLQKPLASAGGLAIRVWDRKSSRIEFDQPHYFQQYVSGSPMSALFRSIRGQIEFVGMTRQYVALPDSKSPEPFGYCASLGPVDLSETKLVNCVKQIGRVVGSTARLNGLFGIDFLLNDGGVWPVEVNPRYTASVEVLELAMQRPLLAGIAGDADREGRDSLNEFVSSADSLSETNEHLAKVPTPCVAKMILFAPQTLVAPVFSAVLETSSLWRVPDLADIPCPGSVIQTGWPICTVMAEGQTSDDCWSNLIDRVRSIWQRLECV